jgi:hypothetical protein
LRAEPTVHEDTVAEEQRGRNLVQRFGEEEPFRSERDFGQRDRAVLDQPVDVRADCARSTPPRS